jgi:hypothetical protein
MITMFETNQSYAAQKHVVDKAGIDYHLDMRQSLSIQLRKICLKTGLDIGAANGVTVPAAAAFDAAACCWLRCEMQRGGRGRGGTMGSGRKANDAAGVGRVGRHDRFGGGDGGCMYNYRGGNRAVPHHDAKLK